MRHTPPLPTICLAVCLYFITACSDLMPVNSETNNKRYFDLNAYFEQQIAQLYGTIVRKTVTLNGTTETKEQQPRDWQTELSGFIASDINSLIYSILYYFTVLIIIKH